MENSGIKKALIVLLAALFLIVVLIVVSIMVSSRLASYDDVQESAASGHVEQNVVSDIEYVEEAAESEEAEPDDFDSADTSEQSKEADNSTNKADDFYSLLNITVDLRDEFIHGEKGAAYQKWIMIHDTESDASASSVVDYWDSSNNKVAAHFVINKDGSIVQCVPLDKIAHHAGYGDTGHNASFGVSDESRDDKVGTTSIGSWAADYGMNSFSIGIELVHVGSSGEDYPTAQLEALDNLIAYIDAYYGFESEITDHKAWRSGNSDTSAMFSTYLANYKAGRSYKG
jgi:N-acetyl-anhydromuramyl-L-alanine amidase AmpD